MTLKTTIKDGRGTGNLTGVSSAGELIVGAFGSNSNQANNQSLANNGQAYNFFLPMSNHTFIITSIILSVKANTTLTLFSAPSATSTTADTTLISTTILNATTLAIPFSFGGFLPVGEGEFLNATTNNATSQVTIIGYYVPV